MLVVSIDSCVKFILSLFFRKLSNTNCSVHNILPSSLCFNILINSFSSKQFITIIAANSWHLNFTNILHDSWKLIIFLQTVWTCHQWYAVCAGRCIQPYHWWQLTPSSSPSEWWNHYTSTCQPPHLLPSAVFSLHVDTITQNICIISFKIRGAKIWVHDSWKDEFTFCFVFVFSLFWFCCEREDLVKLFTAFKSRPSDPARVRNYLQLSKIIYKCKTKLGE